MHPSGQELREATERFAHLLCQPGTKEAVWQELSSDCPYILFKLSSFEASPWMMYLLVDLARAKLTLFSIPVIAQTASVLRRHRTEETR